MGRTGWSEDAGGEPLSGSFRLTSLTLPLSPANGEGVKKIFFSPCCGPGAGGGERWQHRWETDLFEDSAFFPQGAAGDLCPPNQWNEYRLMMPSEAPPAPGPAKASG